MVEAENVVILMDVEDVPAYPMSAILDVTLFLIKCLIVFNPRNSVSCILNNAFILPGPEKESTAYLKYPRIERKFRKGLRALHAQSETNNSFRCSLTKAMCRLKKLGEAGRIIIFKNKSFEQAHFVQTQNCAFAAVKEGIVMDCLDLRPQGNCPLLKKLAGETDGLYLSQEEFSLQQLLSWSQNFLLMPASMRKSFHIPSAFKSRYLSGFNEVLSVDKNFIDVGLVCSACLSVYSAVQSSCLVCGTQIVLN